MKRGLLFLIIVLVCISYVSAAEISGEIYDLSLEPVKNVIVNVNTIPEQRIISKEGSYSFNVPIGDYKITARKEVGTTAYSAEENITIKDDGKYKIDLFLYPEIDTKDDTPEVNNELFEDKKSNSLVFVVIVLVAVVVIVLVVIFLIKRKKITTATDKEENDLDRIVSIIKQQDGRATQKEIRKEMPHSEAKISLMIAELEHKGIVEKIKKGRGNIIILKR